MEVCTDPEEGRHDWVGESEAPRQKSRADRIEVRRALACFEGRGVRFFGDVGD